MCKTAARGKGLGAYALLYDADGLSTSMRTVGVQRGRGVSKVLRARAANTFKKNSGVYIQIQSNNWSVTETVESVNSGGGRGVQGG